MKQTIFVLQILFITSCTKEVSCLDERFTCTHTVYYGFQACPDPKVPNQWKFSNCKSYQEKEEVTACDTSAWLLKARLFDKDRIANDSINPTWAAFTRLYPNECNCK